MEASTTTLNISAPAAAPVEAAPAPVTNFTNERVIHNHKNIFGRYVAGCRKCEELHPEGPPARKPKKEASTGLTREEVIALLREHAPAAVAAGEAQAGTLETLVQLMMARESKTMVKDAEDEARRLKSREDMVRVAREQEALKLNMQTNCGWEYGRPGSHTKENGNSAINGQVHNDGLYHPICFRCFKAFPPRRPTGEMMSRGVSI